MASFGSGRAIEAGDVLTVYECGGVQVPGSADERDVPGVERAHRGDQADRPGRPTERGAEGRPRPDDLHYAGSVPSSSASAATSSSSSIRTVCSGPGKLPAATSAAKAANAARIASRTWA